MEKVVIAASASLQNKIAFWKNEFERKGYEVIACPEKIQGDITKEYPIVFTDFLRSIEKCEVLFVLNEDRKGISGYIGAETFAELCYAVAQNLLHNTKIKIYLLKMPSKKVHCSDEINLWIEAGIVKIIDI